MSEKFLNEARTGELWQAVKDYTIPSKSLTKSEYNALSEEEKMADVEYIITDDNFYNGSSGGISEEIYSTEEVCIGTWIDGKPLYRKTFTFTTPSATKDDTIAFYTGIENISNVTNIVCVIFDDSKSRWVPTSIYASSSFRAFFAVWDKGKEVRCSLGSALTNKLANCILEYTKTTD